MSRERFDEHVQADRAQLAMAEAMMSLAEQMGGAVREMARLVDAVTQAGRSLDRMSQSVHQMQTHRPR